MTHSYLKSFAIKSSGQQHNQFTTAVMLLSPYPTRRWLEWMILSMAVLQISSRSNNRFDIFDEEEIEMLENHLANNLVEVICSGSSQAPNEPGSQSYFSPLLDAMTTLDYQYPEEELLQNHAANVNISQDFDSQMTAELPWEGQNFLPESNPNHLLGILDAVEQENFAYYSSVDISGNATNLQGSTR